MGTLIVIAALVSTGCYQSRGGSDAGGGGTDGGGVVTDSGGVGTDGAVSDAVTFCMDQRFWECRRDQFAGRITDAEFEACVAPTAMICAGSAWPAGCRPTPQQTDACLMLLQRLDLADVPTAELYSTYAECDLCP